MPPPHARRGNPSDRTMLRSIIAALLTSIGILVHGAALAESPLSVVLDGGQATRLFDAPRRLTVELEGLAGDSGARALLENATTGDRLEFPVDRFRTPVVRAVKVPDDWVGQPVRIVVENPRGHGPPIRIQSVEAVTPTALAVRQAGSLAIPIANVLLVVVLLAPGLLLVWSIPGLDSSGGFAPALALLGTCAIGYLAFWLYLANPGIGRAASIAAIVFGLAIPALRRNRPRAKGMLRDSFVPLLLLLLASTFYVSVLYTRDSGETPDTVATSRFFLSRTLDNLIPEHFADRIDQGGDPRVTGSEWKSSDRPPLQTGVVLLVRPVTDAIGIPSDLAYQLVGTILQCSWILVLWCVFVTLEVPWRSRAIVLALTLFSGFFLYNSVYVWPKLLAASLMILAALAVMRGARDGKVQSTALLTAAGAAALALLAHSGSVFSLVGLALLLGASGMVSIRKNLGSLALACLVAISLLLPWTAYQKLYDPPGDRLLKIHLAGVKDLHDERSAGSAIVDSWRSLTAGDIVVRRLRNLRTLTGVDGVMSSAVEALDPRLTAQTVSDPLLMWRTREQQHVGTSLGLLNLGWIALAVIVFRRRPLTKPNRLLLLLVGSGLAGLATASCLLFWAGSTVTTHVSYADILLLHFGLALAFARVFPRAVLALLAAHLIHFSVIWLLTTPPIPDFELAPAMNLPAVLVALLSAAAIALLLRWIASLENTAGEAA